MAYIKASVAIKTANGEKSLKSLMQPILLETEKTTTIKMGCRMYIHNESRFPIFANQFGLGTLIERNNKNIKIDRNGVLRYISLLGFCPWFVRNIASSNVLRFNINKATINTELLPIGIRLKFFFISEPRAKKGRPINKKFLYIGSGKCIIKKGKK